MTKTKTIHILLSYYSSTKWYERMGRLFEEEGGGAYFKFRPSFGGESQLSVLKIDVTHFSMKKVIGIFLSNLNMRVL